MCPSKVVVQVSKTVVYSLVCVPTKSWPSDQYISQLGTCVYVCIPIFFYIFKDTIFFGLPYFLYLQNENGIPYFPIYLVSLYSNSTHSNQVGSWKVFSDWVVNNTIRNRSHRIWREDKTIDNMSHRICREGKVSVVKKTMTLCVYESENREDGEGAFVNVTVM